MSVTHGAQLADEAKEKANSVPVESTPADLPTQAEAERSSDVPAESTVAEVKPTEAQSTSTEIAEVDKGIEIQSLSQGTLEPISVEQPEAPVGDTLPTRLSLDDTTANGPKAEPAIAALTPTRSEPAPVAHRKPASAAVGLKISRSAIALSSMGVLLLFGIAVVALRSGARAGSAPNVSSPNPIPNPVAAPVQQPEDPAVGVQVPTPNSVVPMQPEPRSMPGAASPSPSLATNPASRAQATGVEDTVRVAIRIRPEGARVFYRGKEVGRTPFTLELLRDERRVFEVGYPGYQSRRLVIDGTEGEIAYTLTPNN